MAFLFRQIRLLRPGFISLPELGSQVMCLLMCGKHTGYLLLASILMHKVMQLHHYPTSFAKKEEWSAFREKEYWHCFVYSLSLPKPFHVFWEMGYLSCCHNRIFANYLPGFPASKKIMENVENGKSIFLTWSGKPLFETNVLFQDECYMLSPQCYMLKNSSCILHDNSL